MTTYTWYEKVNLEEPLSQGDLIRACPVLTYSEVEPALGESINKALESAVTAQEADCIIMTQACDLAFARVREVIMCPVYDIEQFRPLWDDQKKKQGQNPTENAWRSNLNEIREGKIWNLTLLNHQEEAGSQTPIPFQVVDFHEIFSLPRSFLDWWVKQNQQERVRLLPPYREHLSQAFARYFMRVGLPEDIPQF